MKAFRSGDLDVLVATTVIEVGIDVPNATVMVIRDADRFGLSQLHQLRGRVGRGSHPGQCVLLADPATKEGTERIAAMVNISDGFRLAEEGPPYPGPRDRLRGPPVGVLGPPNRQYPQGPKRVDDGPPGGPSLSWSGIHDSTSTPR